MDTLDQGQVDIGNRLVSLEKGQRKLQKYVSTIKKDVKAVWGDITRLDNNRLTKQEEKTNIR
ncbi:hypothetical protein [Desulfotruncus arcticus]|uniref:hypothetical protein n=1 Tax=Desulfotruncus arcticus TaxID=341036 RepID=UPI0010422C68|nr:hypothetical protein [Desulfotruncus arcticus]